MLSIQVKIKGSSELSVEKELANPSCPLCSTRDLYRTRYLGSLSHSLFTHLISLDRIKLITRISRIKPYASGQPLGKMRA